MHPLSIEPSPYQRVRAMSDVVRHGDAHAHDSVDADVALRVNGTRNASRASTSTATSAPPSPHVKTRHTGKRSYGNGVRTPTNSEKPDAAAAAQCVDRGEFHKAFSKAKTSLLYFDERAKKAYETYPFQATNLHKKVEEYACAAQELLLSLSPDADANNASCQRQALNRLITATHALIDAFPEWEQRSMTSSPSLKDFLHTLMGKPKPLEDVQKHLNHFSVWLESKSAILNNQLVASVKPLGNHFC